MLPARSRHAALLTAFAAVAILAFQALQADGPAEIRALWVLRSTLASPESIATVVEHARASGFNTLLAQVRGRGDAYYRSTLEPRAEELDRRPVDFDPLATLLAAARPAGLRVHAWVNVNFVSSAANLPALPTHVIHRHPEWLMVPRPIAREMATVDVASPAYVGRLARWARGQPTDIEGLYASPIHPGATDFVERVVSELAGRYELDGIHLDYIRYPDDRFDYSRYAIAEFRAEVGRDLADADRRRLDALAVDDPLAWPDALPDRWTSFRRARLSALVMRLRTAIKVRRPRALVSVAVAPKAADAYARRLQDWRTWLESGLIDAVCPMAYSPEPDVFARQIAAARGFAGARSVWAGIGAYRLTAAQTIERIRSARQQGADGIVLFSYDSLADAALTRELYLAQVGRAAFAASDGSR